MASQRINFTKAALEAIAPPAANYDFYFDTNKAAPRGFGLWVTKAGSKTFALYRKVNGRPERIRIGHFPDISIEAARKKAETFNSAIAHGNNPNDKRRSARNELTLATLFDEYLERYAKVKTKRWADSQAIFTNHFAGFAKRKVSNLKKSDIQRWHADLGRNSGNYMANRCLQLLRAVINWGAKEAAIIDPGTLDGGSNPATGIKPFPEIKRDRFLQGDELPRFFRALAEEPSQDMRDFFVLALLTGARKMNIAAMRTDQINLSRAEWRIPDEFSKSGEAIVIPLVPQALEVIQRRIKGRKKTPYIFSSDSVTGHITSPKKAWRRILDRAELYSLIKAIAEAKGWNEAEAELALTEARKREAKALLEYRAMAEKLDLHISAKLSDLRIHDLRRSLGSWQAATGASLAIIGKTLGHKTASATQIYARLNLDPVRQAMEAATGALLTAGGLLPPADGRNGE